MFGRKHLASQLALAMHTLKFYGKRDNYRAQGAEVIDGRAQFSSAPVCLDNGAAARATLGAIRSLQERRPFFARVFRRKPQHLGTFVPTTPAPRSSQTTSEA